jgi:hypothetical protein
VRRRAKKFGLEIVMVNVWEHKNARDEALHFCKIHGIQGPVLLDPTGEYINRLGLRGVPNNVVVNRKGVVTAVGTTTPDEVRATLTKLLLPFG